MSDAMAGLALFNAVATAGKTLYEIADRTTKHETKQQLMEVYDTLMNLKRQAGELEDQNRELKEKLRFKSDDFEFKNPFWFDKKHPDRPLCPKCFSKHVVVPVAAPYNASDGVYRRCLSCETAIRESNKRIRLDYGPQGDGGAGGDRSWMR